MAKLNLPDIGTLANNAAARQAINDNFTAIEQAIENTLSRNGLQPNQMEADLDMDSNDILNANIVDAQAIYINGVPIGQSFVYGSVLYKVYTADGVLTGFPLGEHPGSLGNLDVSIDGVTQVNGEDFTFTGTTLQFTVAPPNLSKILARFAVSLPLGTAEAGATFYTPLATGIPTTVQEYLDTLFIGGDTSTGALLVKYRQVGVDAVERTVQDKLRELFSVNDMGAVGDGVTDNTLAIAAADAAAFLLGKTLHFPSGTYVSDNLTATAPWVGDGIGKTIIKRSATAATGTFVTAGSSVFEADGLTLDGNKADNSNACNVLYLPPATVGLKIANVRVTNAKLNAGFGSGMVVDGLTDTAGSYIRNCTFDLNDASGAAVQNAAAIAIEGNTCADNGTDGMYLNNYDATLTQKVYFMRVCDNHFTSNGNNGLVVGNYVQNNNQAFPDYGQANPEFLYSTIHGNTALENGFYGIAVGGYALAVADNVCVANAQAASTTANILFTAQYSTLTGNVAEASMGCGIDAGGAKSSTISSNVLHANATVGLNLEANISLKVIGNFFEGNGPVGGGVNLVLDRYGGASVSQGFTAQTDGVVITDNMFKIDGTRYGIHCVNNPGNVDISGNRFQCASPASDRARCIIAIGDLIKLGKNRILDSAQTALTVSGGGVLEVPDVMDLVSLDSATTIGALQTVSTSLVGTGVAYVGITGGGAGYTSPPTISFSGGGPGVGAAAIALVSKAGVLTGIRMTAHGSGYTSAPTVNIVGGGGGGATAVAAWKLGIPEDKELTLQFSTAETITRAGFHTVENPPAADIVAPVRGVLTLRGLFGFWYLQSKNF